MKKKGFTIIEVLVSMAIFLVVATLAVGAFVTVTRMRALSGNMKESQQKIRIAVEMVTRLARQAEKVVIADGKTADLYFSLSEPANKRATRFKIEENTLNMYDCTIFSSPKECQAVGGWNYKIDLLGGSVNLDVASSGFFKEGTIPAKLNVTFNSRVGAAGDNPYFSDDFSINTAVILEALK